MTHQPSLDVGKEVLAYCNRCKLQLAHLITVMKDPVTPLKVQCKTCQSIHSFKIAAGPKTSASGGVKKMVFGKSKGDKEQVTWQDRVNSMSLSANHGKETHKYSLKHKYGLGDVISHPQFGMGFVEEIIDNDKIGVLFKIEFKTLMHNKK